MANDVHNEDRPSIQLSRRGSEVNTTFAVRRGGGSGAREVRAPRSLPLREALSARPLGRGDGARTALNSGELLLFRLPIRWLKSRLQAKGGPKPPGGTKKEQDREEKAPRIGGLRGAKERVHFRRDGRTRSRKLEKVPARDAVKPGATRRVLGDWQAQRVGCINILHDSVPSIG